MIKRTENIQGVVSRHSYTYDGIGRLKQTIYPSGFGIENKYQNGYLQEVIRTDNGNSIWKGEIFNIRNQPKQYLNGNNLRTTLNYDDYGFLTSIQTPGIQNLEYNFDTQTGNLNYRKDVPKNLQENFTYDNLMKNRLETWQVNSGGKDTIIYYANGNIDSKTLLGSYQYESSRPHAVTGVDNTNNWIETQEQTISYTPFNKVEKIRQSDYKLQIIYTAMPTRRFR
jgi:YD repeat-containing protein